MPVRLAATRVLNRLRRVLPGRRRRCRVCVLTLLRVALGLTVLQPLALACDQPLRSSAQPDGSLTLDDQLLQRIADEAGCRLDWVALDLSTARRLHMLREGELAVAAAATPDREREQYAAFSQPYRRDVVRVFVHRQLPPAQWPATETQLLSGPLQVMAVRKAVYGPRYTQLVQALAAAGRLRETSSLASALQTLRATPPRVHLLLADDYGVIHTLAGQPDPSLPTPLVIDSEPLTLMFSRRVVGADTVSRFDGAIRRLQQRGELAGQLRAAGYPTLALPASP